MIFEETFGSENSIDASTLEAQMNLDINTTPAENAAGPGPRKPKADNPSPNKSFFSSMEQDANMASQQLRQLQQPGQTGYYNPTAVDTFTSQENFKGELFNPGDYQGNYDKQASMETWSSTFGKAFDDFGYKFKNSFTESFASYGRIGDALMSMDWSKMDPDENEMIQTYFEDQQNEATNRIFQTEEEDNSFFNKQFAKDFIGNSGFALGTASAIGLEIAADIAIEALTMGAATPAVAASAAGITAKLARIGKGFSMGNRSAEQIRAGKKLLDTVEEGAQLGQLTSKASSVARAAQASAAETLRMMSLNYKDIVKAEGLFNKALKAMEQVPVAGNLLRTGRKLGAAKEAGYGTAEMLGIGLQGFRRSMAELNMSSSEASFEAISTYGDTLSKMVEEYENTNGELPSGFLLQEMKQKATEASAGNYNSNLGILMVTNKLQFGNLFSKYLPGNKLVREFIEEASEDVMTISKKGVTVPYIKGFFGTYGLGKEIAKDFGKKEAMLQIGKSFLKDFGRFELTEGLQENIQEISATGWKNYYASMYSRDPKSMMHSLDEGLGEQFTEQGAKTFIQGAFTGSMLRVPMKLSQAAMSGMQSGLYAARGIENPADAAKEQVKTAVSDLKTFYKTAAKDLLNDKVFNFKAQQAAAANMTQAAGNGQTYEFINAQENAMLAAVKAARSTNSLDSLIIHIENLGQSFDQDAFKEAFQLDIKDTKYGSVDSFTRSIAGKIRQYSETIDDVKRTLGVLTDASMYKAGSKAQYVTAYYNQAVENAAEILALNRIKSDMSAKRASQLAGEMGAIAGLESSSDTALRVLTRPDNLKEEAGLILSEIGSLKEQLKEITDPKLKKELQDRLDSKEEELQTLSEWEKAFEYIFEDVERDVMEDVALTEAELKARKKGDTSTTKKVSKGKTNVNVYKEGRFIGDPEDKTLMEVFRKLMNIKNRQSGIKTRLTEESIQKGFKSIVDYIKLDQDTRDYLDVVDAMTDPDKYRMMVARMLDGRFKLHIAGYLENIKNVMIMQGITAGLDFDKIDQAVQAVYTSEAYKNIVALYISQTDGIEKADYLNDLQDQITKIFEKTTGTSIDIETSKTGKSSRITPEERAERRKRANNKAYPDRTPWVKKGTNATKLYLLPGDDRIAEDIMDYYNIQDQESGSLQQVVQKAIDNPFTHPYLKEAFTKFLPYIQAGAVIQMDRMQQTAPGLWDGEKIVMDPDMIDGGLMSFEGVLLHEMIHYFTAEELNVEGPFRDQINALYENAVAELIAQGVDTSYYGFSNINEFLAEAYSNPEFQRELQNVKTQYGVSAWETFLDRLSQFLKDTFGIDMKASALDDIFNAVEDFITDATYDNAVAQLKNSGLTDQEIQMYNKRDIISLAKREGLLEAQVPQAPKPQVVQSFDMVDGFTLELVSIGNGFQLFLKDVNGDVKDAMIPDPDAVNLQQAQQAFEDVLAYYKNNEIPDEFYPQIAGQQQQAQTIETVTPPQFSEVLRLAKFFVENPKEPGTIGDARSKFPNLYNALFEIEKQRQEQLLLVKNQGSETIIKGKLPKKIDKYFPNIGEGLQTYETDKEREGASLFFGEKNSKGQYEVYPTNTKYSTQNLLNNRFDLITPLFDEGDVFNEKSEKLTVARPAIIEIVNGKTKIIEKGELFYGEVSSQPKTDSSSLDKINAKFNAEISALEAPIGTTPAEQALAEKYAQEIFQGEERGRVIDGLSPVMIDLVDQKLAALQESAPEAIQTPVENTNNDQVPDLGFTPPIESNEDGTMGTNTSSNDWMNGIQDILNPEGETETFTVQPVEVVEVTETTDTEDIATGGFDVKDASGITVNPNPLTEKQAQKEAEKLRAARAEADFIMTFLGPFGGDANMIAQFQTAGLSAMKSYNRSNKTKFKSLESFAEIVAGKQILEEIKTSVTTGQPISKKKKTTKKTAETASTVVQTLFDTSDTKAGAGLTPSDLKSMHVKLVDIINKGLQNQEENSKFVERGSSVSTENEVLDLIREVTTCFIG